MKEVVLITGANGVLAQHLEKVLENTYTIKFLTRRVKGKNEFLWDLNKNYIDPEAFKDVNHIIHLAWHHWKNNDRFSMVANSDLDIVIQNFSAPGLALVT